MSLKGSVVPLWHWSVLDYSGCFNKIIHPVLNDHLWKIIPGGMKQIGYVRFAYERFHKRFPFASSSADGSLLNSLCSSGVSDIIAGPLSSGLSIFPC